MGKNINRRFTVRLDIDTKDAEKQIQSTVGNLKTILAEMGTASDKMKYFKELADYLSQVDAEMDRLKHKHGGDFFEKMFGGLDKNLRQEMEKVFGAAKSQLDQLNKIRDKMSKIDPTIDTEESRAEIKKLEQEARELFAALNISDKIKLSGKGKIETRLKSLGDALNSFGELWDGINNKIKDGLSFGGGGTGSGSKAPTEDLSHLSESVRIEIDKLQKQLDELNAIKTKLQQVAKLSKDVVTKNDIDLIPDSYKPELTIKSIQQLMDEFDDLNKRLNDGGPEADNYYQNLLKITEVSLSLKKALGSIRADNSVKELFMNAPSGHGDNMLGRLSMYANKKTSTAFNAAIYEDSQNSLAPKIQDVSSRINALKNANQTAQDVNTKTQDSNKKTIMSYEELKQKVKEYHDLAKEFRRDDLDDDEFDVISDKMEKLEKVISKLAQSKNDAEKTIGILQQMQLKDVNVDDAFGKISNILGIEDIQNTAPAISQAKTQLEEFLALAKKMQGYTSVDGLDIQSALNDLEAARGKLKELEQQGEITAQEMQDVIKAFVGASSNLKMLSKNAGAASAGFNGTGVSGGKGAGIGGSGSGVSISSEDLRGLEQILKTELTALAGKLDNVLQVHLVKDDTKDIQQAIKSISVDTNDIALAIDNYKATKEQDKEQSKVDNMKQTLLQMLKTVTEHNSQRERYGAQSQELGMALMSSGNLSVGYGEDGSVPWNVLISSMAKELGSALIADIHSHPINTNFFGRDNFDYLSDSFSGSTGDIGAFSRSKQLGAQISGMITGNILRVLDLSGLSQSDMTNLRKALARLESDYAKDPKYSKYLSLDNNKNKIAYKGQTSLDEYHKTMQIFESMIKESLLNIGLSQDYIDNQIYKKYDLTNDAQLTELATRLVTLCDAADTSVEPVQRLADIISKFGGDTSSTQAKTLFDSFEKGETSAVDVINKLIPEKYQISQKAVDAANYMTPDQPSAIESILNNIASILGAISTAVDNIDLNSRKGTDGVLESAANDLNTASRGVDNKYLSHGVKSIYNPANITEYYSKRTSAMAEDAAYTFETHFENIRNAFHDFGDIDIAYLLHVFDNFKQAWTYLNDAIDQANLYRNSTGKSLDVIDSDTGEVTYSHMDNLMETQAQLQNYAQELAQIMSHAQSTLGGSSPTLDVDTPSIDFSTDGASLTSELGQLQMLNLAIQNIRRAVQEKNEAFKEEETIVSDVVFAELESLKLLSSSLLEIINLLDKINERWASLGTVNSNLNSIQEISTSKQLGDQVANIEDASNNYALDSTLLATNDILTQILTAVNNGSTLSGLVEPLNNAVAALNKVAGGVAKQPSQSAGVGTSSATPLSKKIYNQSVIFDDFRKEIVATDYVTNELNQQINALAISLKEVMDETQLDEWKAQFIKVRSEASLLKDIFESQGFADLRALRGKLNSAIKPLDFSMADSNLTNEQAEIVGLRNKLLAQLEEYESAIKQGKNVELSSINETIDALNQKINAYKIANDYVNAQGKTGKSFGATITSNATAKFNSLKEQATGNEFASSKVIKEQLAQYEAAYNRLKVKREEFAELGDDKLTDSQINEFNRLKETVSAYAKVLTKTITDTRRLKSQAANDTPWMLDEDFQDTQAGRKAALTDFVQSMYGASIAAEDFKNNYNECVFAVDNGDGTFTQMKATFTGARNEIVALAGDVKKSVGVFEAYWNELKSKFRTISTYIVSSLSFQEIFQQIRKGVTYIREIDSALVELKKVTDETDASYEKFLQDMSKTAGVIGSTVADLTTMAAEWGRLGYSMAESAKLAESTAILLNVSEFDDATKASEALISTMQAFQYTADESQHVVDILNEIGKCIAYR